MYTNELLESDKHLQGNTRGHIIMACFGYMRFVSLRKKVDTHLYPSEVFQEVEVTNDIHDDNKRELNLAHWKEICERHIGIKTLTTEPNYTWKNRYEQGIDEAKGKATKTRHKKRSPSKVWGFVIMYAEEMWSMIAFKNSHLKGSMLHEVLTGDMTSIFPYFEC